MQFKLKLKLLMVRSRESANRPSTGGYLTRGLYKRSGRVVNKTIFGSANVRFQEEAKPLHAYSSGVVTCLQTVGRVRPQVHLQPLALSQRRALSAHPFDKSAAGYPGQAVLQKLPQSAEGHERLFLKRPSGTAKRRTSPDLVHHSLLIF